MKVADLIADLESGDRSSEFLKPDGALTFAKLQEAVNRIREIPQPEFITFAVDPAVPNNEIFMLKDDGMWKTAFNKYHRAVKITGITI